MKFKHVIIIIISAFNLSIYPMDDPHSDLFKNLLFSVYN